MKKKFDFIINLQIQNIKIIYIINHRRLMETYSFKPQLPIKVSNINLLLKDMLRKKLICFQLYISRTYYLHILNYTYRYQQWFLAIQN